MPELGVGVVNDDAGYVSIVECIKEVGVSECVIETQLCWIEFVLSVFVQEFIGCANQSQ